MCPRIVLRWISAIAGLLTLSGCAVAVLFSMGPDQRASLFLVPADKAVIYIYHDDTVGHAPAPAVYVDGEPLGEPTTAGFWYHEVVPGRHTVAMAGAEADGVVLEAVAGHVYFVGEDVECAPRPLSSLHAVNEAAGRARVRALVAASKSPPSDVNGAATSTCGATDAGTDGTAL